MGILSIGGSIFGSREESDITPAWMSLGLDVSMRQGALGPLESRHGVTKPGYSDKVENLSQPCPWIVPETWGGGKNNKKRKLGNKMDQRMQDEKDEGKRTVSIKKNCQHVGSLEEWNLCIRIAIVLEL
jgi:hypothetical protein